MSPHAASSKSRTVALAHVNKSLLRPRPLQPQLNGRASVCEDAWGQMTFGPYLVPLSRRVE